MYGLRVFVCVSFDKFSRFLLDLCVFDGRESYNRLGSAYI